MKAANGIPFPAYTDAQLSTMLKELERLEPNRPECTHERTLERIHLSQVSKRWTKTEWCRDCGKKLKGGR